MLPWLWRYVLCLVPGYSGVFLRMQIIQELALCWSLCVAWVSFLCAMCCWDLITPENTWCGCLLQPSKQAVAVLVLTLTDAHLPPSPTPTGGQTPSDACTVCPAGTFSANRGTEKCLSCPLGFWSQEGAESEEQCYPINQCPAGTGEQ